MSKTMEVKLLINDKPLKHTDSMISTDKHGVEYGSSCYQCVTVTAESSFPQCVTTAIEHSTQVIHRRTDGSRGRDVHGGVAQQSREISITHRGGAGWSNFVWKELATAHCTVLEINLGDVCQAELSQ